MNEVLNQNWLFNPQPLSAKPHKHTAFLDKHLNSIDTNNNFSRLKQNSRLIHKKTSAFMHQEHHQLNQLLESQENQVQTDENKSNTVFKAYNKKKQDAHNPRSATDYNLNQSVKNKKPSPENRKILEQGLCEKSKHLVEYLNKDGNLMTSKEIKVSNLSSNIFHLENV